ncbi:Uncharacterized protein Fot_44656 [Forsythia ovata]|uniref:Uncharacterized protein n=1 Tax=Forsythia ovata TaxID=205694 RepID=A0ABD1R449_9LAMI
MSQKAKELTGSAIVDDSEEIEEDKTLSPFLANISSLSLSTVVCALLFVLLFITIREESISWKQKKLTINPPKIIVENPLESTSQPAITKVEEKSQPGLDVFKTAASFLASGGEIVDMKLDV